MRPILSTLPRTFATSEVPRSDPIVSTSDIRMLKWLSHNFTILFCYEKLQDRYFARDIRCNKKTERRKGQLVYTFRRRNFSKYSANVLYLSLSIIFINHISREISSKNNNSIYYSLRYIIQLSRYCTISMKSSLPRGRKWRNWDAGTYRSVHFYIHRKCFVEQQGERLINFVTTQRNGVWAFSFVSRSGKHIVPSVACAGVFARKWLRFTWKGSPPVWSAVIVMYTVSEAERDRTPENRKRWRDKFWEGRSRRANGDGRKCRRWHRYKRVRWS